MFLLLGKGEGEHDLQLHQAMKCPICGQKGHLEAYFSYESLNVFFVPTVKWKKCYYVRTSCCGTVAPLSAKKGEKIYWGQLEKLKLDTLHFAAPNDFKVCKHCGFDTMQPFHYCPMCGKPLEGTQKCLK